MMTATQCRVVPHASAVFAVVPLEFLYVMDVSPYQDWKDIMDSFVQQTQS